MAYPDDPTDQGRVEQTPEFINDPVDDPGMAEPLGTPAPGLIVEDTTFRTVDEPSTGGRAEHAKQEAKDLAGHTQDRAKDVADNAKAEAGAVRDTVVAAGSDVVDSAKEQAANVIDEAKLQSRRLLDEGVSELRTQAGSAQGQVAAFVRSLSDELQSMGRGTDESGPMVDLVNRAEQYGHQAADWLEQNSPDDVLASARRYASRNPWTFLAISAGAGLVAARLFRGLQGAKADEEGRRQVTSGVQTRGVQTRGVQTRGVETGYYAGTVGGYREAPGLEYQQGRAAEYEEDFASETRRVELEGDLDTTARRNAEWGEGR
ncbi:hypothetical protein PCC79_12205 [Propioniciclava soli]|uniref:DUF3618 domain-containing protein n=1 Tax=Propioniciclava soli TaxID=2775081 RepID=A0ABZ3C4F8_9ACTN